MVAFLPAVRRISDLFKHGRKLLGIADVPEVTSGRYSAAIMVSSPRLHPRGLPGRAREAAGWARALILRQFVTENRRLAFALAVVTVAIVVMAVHVSVWWFSPGVVILPILAG